MSLYEQYANYHITDFTETELAALRSATSGEATTRTHMDIAILHATKQRNGINLPEDSQAMKDFHDVAPEGKHCEIDLKFAQCWQRIEYASAFLSEEGKINFTKQKKALENNQEYQQLQGDIAFTCSKIAINNRAAKICPDKEASARLEQYTMDLSKNSAFDKQEAFLRGMEYMVGIGTQERLDKEASDVLKGFLNIKERDMIQSTPNQYEAVGLDVEFQNFDDMLAQSFLSQPQNWNHTREDVPNDIQNANAGANVVADYAKTTVKGPLGFLYEPTDNLNIQGFNRATLVTVGGKTIHEMMLTEFNGLNQSNGQQANFHDWFQNNYKEKANEYVASGLMAGARVEAFVPDRFGRIPENPIQLTKKGYEPSPLKPVTLGAWEKFMSKCGFYKEKVQKAEEYQAVLASRDRVNETATIASLELTNISSRNVENLFLGDQAEPIVLHDGTTLSNELMVSMAIGSWNKKGVFRQSTDIFEGNLANHFGQEILGQCQKESQYIYGAGDYVGEEMKNASKNIEKSLDKMGAWDSLRDINPSDKRYPTVNALIQAGMCIERESKNPATYGNCKIDSDFSEQIKSLGNELNQKNEQLKSHSSVAIQKVAETRSHVEKTAETRNLGRQM